jgi:uncharacterized membrane protein YgcG
MRCSDFLRRYSDFRDGLITDLTVLRDIQQHLAWCLRCGRYDWTLSWGVGALRTLGEIEPSSNLKRALRTRVGQAGPGTPAAPRAGLTPAGVAAAALLAVAVALLVSEGVAVNRDRRELAQTVRPGPVVVVNPGMPFVSFTAPDRSASRALMVRTTATRPDRDWGIIAP